MTTPTRLEDRRASLPGVARELARVGERFYARGWVLGTSGNFSAITAHAPLRLAITASSVHKGTLREDDILEIDERGAVVNLRSGRPSAETLLHLEIVRRRGAGAVLHTHSVWGTVLSHRHAARGGLEIEGYEMLKGLDGIATHEHREWLPIVENDQDMTRLSARVGELLEREPACHGFLVRRHGLYTWGRDLAAAERHVEILEFLLEAVGRTETEVSNGISQIP